MNRLTDKQAAFIDHYLMCLNATEAAARACYQGNRNTLAAVGRENLRKPKIREEIDRRLRERTMKADEVLYRLDQQATANIGDFFKIVEEWTFYPLPTYDILDAERVIDTSDPDKPEERITYLVRRVAIDAEKLVDPRYSHLLHKVSDTARGGLTIELYNKQNALVHLGKHYALFTDRVKHEDWRTEAIRFIRDGSLPYGVLANELGDDLATELFTRAGVPIAVGAPQEATATTLD